MALEDAGIRYCTGLTNGTPLLGTGSDQNVDNPSSGHYVRSRFFVSNPTGGSVTAVLKYGSSTVISKSIAAGNVEDFGYHEYDNNTTVKFVGSGLYIWANSRRIG